MKLWPMPKWLSISARYAIGVAIICWLFNNNLIDIKSLNSLSGTTIVLLLALTFAQLPLTAWRVKLLLRVHGIHAGMWRCLGFNLVGMFYSTFLPGGMSGDAVRAYYFYRRCDLGNAGKSEIIGALVTDRLIGTLSMIFIGMIAASLSAGLLRIGVAQLSLIWLAMVGGVALYLVVCRRFGEVGPQTSRMTLSKTARFRKILARLDLTSVPPPVLLIATALSLASHLLASIIVYIVSMHLACGLNLGQVMAFAPAGFLFNAIPISPGGLGVGEQGFESLYALAGGRNGGNAFFISRIFLFLPGVFGAVVAAALLMKPRRPQAGSAPEGRNPVPGDGSAAVSATMQVSLVDAGSGATQLARSGPSDMPLNPLNQSP